MLALERTERSDWPSEDTLVCRQTYSVATQNDVREIAAGLPGTVVSDGRFALSVPIKGKLKGYAWTWAERIHPKKPKVINEGVLAVVVPNLTAKQAILDSDPEVYFTEPHYDGYSAVLVRLERICKDELADLLLEAWKCRAGPDLHAGFRSQ